MDSQRILIICALVVRSRFVTVPPEATKWLELADKIDRNIPVTVREIIDL
jgi:hypothetical protein